MFIKLFISFRKGFCLNLWSSLNHWTFHIMWRKDKYGPVIMVLLVCELRWMTPYLMIFLFFKLFHNKWDEPLYMDLISLFSATSHPGLSHDVNTRSPKQENWLTGDFGPFKPSYWLVGYFKSCLCLHWSWQDTFQKCKDVLSHLANVKYQQNVKLKVHDQILLL